MAQPLVISYIRFSTARQASGDSLRRQSLLANQWCIKRGWKLDDSLTLHDLGLSGFNQDNVSRGALSGFLQAVGEGKIPRGSYLLIENLDRLTRADLPTAVTLLLSIAQAGIVCVTLQDDQEWTKERLSNPADFMLSIMLPHRGHDESKVKSKRIRAVHDKAREALDRSVFGRAPGWLQRTADKKAWQPIPERVEVLKKVFELVASGYGGVAIARKANQEGWLVPSLSAIERGTTWHTTLPTKLVRKRSVLGELELCIYRDGKVKSTGTVVPDWYPRVIDDELFYRANAAIDARRGKPPRRDSGYRNVFQGVLFCGHCGATLARKAKGGGSKNSKGYAQYVCSDRHRGVSQCPSMNAFELESSLLPMLFRYFNEHLGKQQHLDAIRDEMAAIDGKAEELTKRKERLAEAIEAAELPLPTLIKRLEVCERELPELEATRNLLKVQLEASAGFPDDDTDAIAIVNAIRGEDEASERLRVEAHAKILMAIDTLWVWRREMVALRLKGSDLVVALPLPDPKQTSNFGETSEGEVATFEPSDRLRLALAGQISPPMPRKKAKA